MYKHIMFWYKTKQKAQINKIRKLLITNIYARYNRNLRRLCAATALHYKTLDNHKCYHYYYYYYYLIKSQYNIHARNVH